MPHAFVVAVYAVPGLRTPTRSLQFVAGLRVHTCVTTVGFTVSCRGSTRVVSPLCRFYPVHLRFTPAPRTFTTTRILFTCPHRYGSHGGLPCPFGFVPHCGFHSHGLRPDLRAIAAIRWIAVTIALLPFPVWIWFWFFPFDLPGLTRSHPGLRLTFSLSRSGRSALVILRLHCRFTFTFTLLLRFTGLRYVRLRIHLRFTHAVCVRIARAFGPMRTLRFTRSAFYATTTHTRSAYISSVTRSDFTRYHLLRYWFCLIYRTVFAVTFRLPFGSCVTFALPHLRFTPVVTLRLRFTTLRLVGLRSFTQFTGYALRIARLHTHTTPTTFLQFGSATFAARFTQLQFTHTLPHAHARYILFGALFTTHSFTYGLRALRVDFALHVPVAFDFTCHVWFGLFTGLRLRGYVGYAVWFTFTFYVYVGCLPFTAVTVLTCSVVADTHHFVTYVAVVVRSVTIYICYCCVVVCYVVYTLRCYEHSVVLWFTSYLYRLFRFYLLFVVHYTFVLTRCDCCCWVWSLLRLLCYVVYVYVRTPVAGLHFVYYRWFIMYTFADLDFAHVYFGRVLHIYSALPRTLDFTFTAWIWFIWRYLPVGLPVCRFTYRYHAVTFATFARCVAATCVRYVPISSYARIYAFIPFYRVGCGWFITFGSTFATHVVYRSRCTHVYCCFDLFATLPTLVRFTLFSWITHGLLDCVVAVFPDSVTALLPFVSLWTLRALPYHTRFARLLFYFPPTRVHLYVPHVTAPTLDFSLRSRLVWITDYRCVCAVHRYIYYVTFPFPFWFAAYGHVLHVRSRVRHG